MYKIPTNTHFIGKNLIAVPQCDSTNTLAMELSKNTNSSEGMVVVADHQTAGRGQRGGVWVADPGQNLTFSILLKPTFLPSKDHFLLNAAISLGIYTCLEKCVDQQVRIKWPNDILIGGLKVCGILQENQLQGRYFTQSIVGVGLNVNQAVFSGFEASSLALITGKKWALSQLLESLLEHIETQYIMLRQGQYDTIKQNYIKVLFGLGQKCLFQREGQSIEGIIRDIDALGCLVVEIAGKVITCNAKEIKLML